MVEGDAVELLKRISQLTIGSRESGVHRDSFHLATVLSSHIHTSTLLDVAEIYRVRCTALVWNHWWPHVADERPLRLSEERVGFDVRGTCSSAETLRLVFDQ